MREASVGGDFPGFGLEAKEALPLCGEAMTTRSGNPAKPAPLCFPNLWKVLD